MWIYWLKVAPPISTPTTSMGTISGTHMECLFLLCKTKNIICCTIKDNGVINRNDKNDSYDKKHKIAFFTALLLVMPPTYTTAPAALKSLNLDNPYEMKADAPAGIRKEPLPRQRCEVRAFQGIMMNKPTVLSTGEWLLTIEPEGRGVAQIWVSTDQGESFRYRGGADVPDGVRAPIEHMLTERLDGSLWMLARTTYGIGESVSFDRGKTWTEVSPSAIAHDMIPGWFFDTQAAREGWYMKSSPK